MNNEFISIIVPCYNQAHFLDEALQSIFDQTYNNWECIIVNDGSTDNTEEQGKNWIKKDNRFKYIHQENKGLSGARNTGLSTVKGSYVQFLDADDVLVSTKLEACMLALEGQNTNTIAVSNFLMLSNQTNKTQPAYCELKQELLTFKNILYRWDIDFTIPIHCGFFPAAVCKDVGFEESLKGKEDWLFWVRITQQVAKVLFIDQPLVFYRLNPKSMSRSDTNMKEYHLQAFSLLSNYLDPQEHKALINSRLNHLMNRVSELNKEKQSLRNSNTYQAGLMLKKLARSIGLLGFCRKCFQYIRKLKKKSH
jgi:glycosyltransferase involved in cell wall biosynthesis